MTTHIYSKPLWFCCELFKGRYSNWLEEKHTLCPIWPDHWNRRHSSGMWCVLRFYHCKLWLKLHFSILWSYGHMFLVVSSARLRPLDLPAVIYNAFNSFDVLWQQPEVSVTPCEPGWAPFPRQSFIFPWSGNRMLRNYCWKLLHFFCAGDPSRVRLAPQVLSYQITLYFG